MTIAALQASEQQIVTGRCGSIQGTDRSSPDVSASQSEAAGSILRGGWVQWVDVRTRSPLLENTFYVSAATPYTLPAPLRRRS